MEFRDMPPQDVFSKVIMLEYMRKLGASFMYDKCSPYFKSDFFYKFEAEFLEEVQIDFNWEKLLFEVTLPQLETFMKPFLEDVVKLVEEEQKAKYKAAASKPVDINLMDVAAAKIKEGRKLDIPKLEI